MSIEEEYVPGRWNEIRRVISTAIFRNGRPELRAMADTTALRMLNGLTDASASVCRPRS
jgi:hypothetical protein